MWETLRCKYFCIMKIVLWTVLYGRNKILAINGFALPVLIYGFGVIHWRTTDLQQLDRRTRKLLSMHGVHHLAADVDWLYAPCTKCGRGLRKIELKYQSCIVGLDCYLHNSSDLFMQMVQECDARRSSHSIQRMACQFTAQLQGSLSKDNKSQSLLGSGTILCDGAFEQAPQADAKHFRMCSGSLFVYSPGAENLCMVSVSVSLTNHLWA